jgi:hypothetical protein
MGDLLVTKGFKRDCSIVIEIVLLIGLFLILMKK